jgi:hypothetical protein
VVVVDVVVAVSVDVTAVVLVIETEVGSRAHVVGLTALDGELVIAQLSETVPVNESEGVTVMVTVLSLVAPAVSVIEPLLERAKLALLFSAFQKSPQPPRNGAAASNSHANFPILIAAPRTQYSGYTRNRSPALW